MTLIWHTTLSGHGDHNLFVNGEGLSDMDYWVSTIGPQVQQSGQPGQKLLRNVGYVVFTNSAFVAFTGQPPEIVGDPIWFNLESTDVVFNFPPGYTVTDIHWSINPGSQVEINITQ